MSGTGVEVAGVCLPGLDRLARDGAGRVAPRDLLGLVDGWTRPAAAGRVDHPRAVVMVEETAVLDPAGAGAVEQAVLARGGRASPGRWRPGCRSSRPPPSTPC